MFLPVYKRTTDDLKEAKRRVLELLKLGWCKYTLGKYDNDQAIVKDANFLMDSKKVSSVCLFGAIIRAKLDPIIYDNFCEKLMAKINDHHWCRVKFNWF